MPRGISITPLTDIFPLDIQQLEGLIGTTYYSFINQFKTGSAINTNAIISTLIGTAAVTTEKIKDDAVTAGKLAASAIGTAEIADGSVTSAKILADAIIETHIAANAVSGAHIAAGTVRSSSIESAGIDHSHIAADTITGAQVIAGTIRSSSVESGGIDTSHIAAGGVTTAKIADAAVHDAAYYVIEGCRVAVNGGGNSSTVTVGVGYINAGGTFVTVANASVASAGITAAGSYKDLIVAQADGALKIVRGTEAVGSVDATMVVLASIINTTADAVITAADIGNSARNAMARY